MLPEFDAKWHTVKYSGAVKPMHLERCRPLFVKNKISIVFKWSRISVKHFFWVKLQGKCNLNVVGRPKQNFYSIP